MSQTPNPIIDLQANQAKLLIERANLQDGLALNEKELGQVRAALHGVQIAQQMAQADAVANTEASTKGE